MLARLGLVGRLVVILLVFLVGFGLLGIGLDWYARVRGLNSGPRVPLPDQIAAVVDVLETSPGTRRDLILRAVNSDQLHVGVELARPASTSGRRLPFAEWLVVQYLEVLPSRDVEVRILPDPGASSLQSWIGWISPEHGLPLRIVVRLRTDEFAVFETRGAPTQRMFGLPTGFWIGVLGALLGMLAMVAIARETKPLADLARAVQRFAGEAKPQIVPARGAPDVKALIEAVNAMQSRISALVQGRTILLGAVSHDLKTYITRLRLRVEELPDDTQRDKATRDLDEMTELIDSAIVVARGSASLAAHEIVDLAALVTREVAARDGARIRFVRPTGAVGVTGDAIGLKRVIGNLADNALRYGERCEIGLHDRPDGVELLVDDDGPGIPEAERSLVLEPFYRSEQSRNRATGGSGLGLAIVAQIVAAHRGRIEILDGPLGGARLRVTLPRG